MGASRRVFTALGGLIFAGLGFAAGTGAASWRARELKAEPWRTVQVAHRGLKRNTTTTRVLFENAKLPLQAVEVVRKPGGEPARGTIEPRGGDAFSIAFDEGRPHDLIAADGRRALITYKGSKARVSFVDAAGKPAGEKVLRVPLGVRPALKETAFVLPDIDLINQAHAQEKAEEDPEITVERQVKVGLSIRLPKVKGPHPSHAQVEASCAPYVCLPITREAAMPGTTEVLITVASSKKKSTLGDAPTGSDLDPYTKVAKAERKLAAKVMPNVAAAIGTTGLVARACRSLGLKWPICVAGLTKSRTSAAVLAMRRYVPKMNPGLVSQRAETLYFEEHARAQLDRPLTIEVCVSADRFNRACTKLSGRPFGVEPMAKEARAVALRKGIGGTLKGDHEMRQRDGSDCKFSPSPKTTGPLTMSFDNEKGVVTAKLKADARGTRPGLACSLGTGDMRWRQNYTATLTQTFSVAQLTGGGKLPLQLKGTMTGRGSGHMSNCRTRGGGSVACPAGKNNTYNYPTTLYGTLDLDTRKGSGTLRVTGSKLSTTGTWSIPGRGN